MKEIGIIMSGNHPQLVRDKIKTVTRRTYGLKKINLQPNRWNGANHLAGNIWAFNDWKGNVESIKCPYGQVGDRLIIKEAWATEKQSLKAQILPAR